ncbi:MAG: hypothetical protein EOO75_06865 [Myxococcales bacterium]|nr:MAG: hypothetical protein EOO75_06865 [Myxococcales bacterium]
MPRLRAASPFALSLAALLLASSPSRAQTPSDADRAQATVTELTASPRAAVIARELDRARDALQRARGARGAGDALHGAQLEALARAWSDAARDVLAAATAEEQAHKAQTQLADARAQIDKERALIEETIARQGRARVELQRAEAEAAARPPLPPPRSAGKKGGGKAAPKSGKKAGTP